MANIFLVPRVRCSFKEEKLKTCIDCHFLASPHLQTESVHPTLQDDRAYLRVKVLGEEADEATKDRLDQIDMFAWAGLKKNGIQCWKGLWSMDQVIMETEEDQVLLRRHVSKDRESTDRCPYLFDFRLSMTLANADQLCEYEVERRDIRRGNKYTRLGIWIAPVALVITAIGTVINLLMNWLGGGGRKSASC